MATASLEGAGRAADAGWVNRPVRVSRGIVVGMTGAARPEIVVQRQMTIQIGPGGNAGRHEASKCLPLKGIGNGTI